MRFRVERDALKAAAARAAHFTAGPPFNGMVLEVEGDKLRLHATDADLSCSTVLAVAGSVNGRAHVPAKRFAGAVAALRDGAVEAELGESSLTVRSGESSATVPLMSALEAPRMPDVPEMAPLAGAALIDALARVTPAASTDDTRGQLLGVFVEPVGDHCTFTATDSHRLATCSVETPWVGENALVPALALKELVKLAAGSDTVTMGTDRNAVSFGVGETVITARLIAAEWIDYRRLIPPNPPGTLLVDREALVDAVKRVGGVLAPDAPVRFGLTPERVLLSAAGEDGATSADSVDAEWGGSELEAIGFRPRFLLDALAAAKSDIVRLGFTDPLKPVLFTSEPADDWLTALMPQRLGA